MTLENIPMLAASAKWDESELYIVNSTWVAEQKLDGHRIILRCQDGLKPLALTRGGNPYTKKLPVDIADGIPPGRWVLDGELCGDTYWVFDLLDANGLVSESTPLSERREVLEAFMTLVNTPKIKLVPQATTESAKRELFDRLREEGAEGVMFKRKDGLYYPGARSKDVLKAKFVETADVVVMALRDDGKDSVALGAYDENMQLVPVGRASLIGKEKKGVFQIGDVLEVRYLYMGSNSRMYQPTILKRRDDKIAPECRTDQFKHVSKKVIL